MLNPRNLQQLIKRYEKHANLIEKEYKRKNIIHRLREDFGYSYTVGKIEAYKFILKEMIN